MADTTTIQANRTDSVIEVQLLGGPPGPKGDAAEIYIKGVATAWPPVDHPAVGDLYVIPTTPPTGAPAWAVASHGAFWDGTAWVDAGLLVGPKGDRGEPGPPLNIKGTALAWVPDAAPKAGDLWILPDPLPVGTPAGFTAGGAASWDAVASRWIPLQAIRGPAGRSVQVFGPSATPPIGVPLYKGDIWLSTDPTLFSPTFDPSTIVPAPGPAGPPGPAGASAYETWKTIVGRPTAAMSDYLDAIKGAPGATGAKGPAGETLKVEGIVTDEAHLPATPPNLTVYMTRDGVLFIYNPTSTAAAASGWVNLGKIAGPAGQPATMTPAVATDADRPAVGLPGQMVYVNATGHVWGWDDVAKAWVDGGKFGVGAGSIDDGTTQGQMLVWDDTAHRWAAADVLRLPSGTDDGDLISWDASLGQWVTAANEFGAESNVDLPQTPLDGEGSVPVYDYNANRFGVRRLRMEDIDDGPGAYVPAAGDLLGWDAVLNRYVPTPAPAGTLAGLSDVDYSHVAPVSGMSIVYDALTQKWHPGNAAASIPEYSNISMYSSEQVVYHQGRFWRSSRAGLLATPDIATGAAMAMINLPGRSGGVQVFTSISNAAPVTPPTGQFQTHLRWVSDADWDIYEPHLDVPTRVWSWQLTTLAKKTVWRHVALPSPDSTPSNAVLWIYGLPGSNHAPIVNQTDWRPINLGDFLVSLADVDAAKAVNGDVLTADGTGRWHAAQPAGYTKAEVDTRLNAVVSGLEHGVSAVAITNDPPTTPVDDEVYIVGTTPTGAFVGHANELAVWSGTAWTFAAPQAKEAHLVEDQAAVYAWNSTTRLWAKVAQGTTASTGDGMPVGAIIMWPTGSMPTNYLELNGSHYDAVAYPDLYRILGTDTLPDFRDRYVRGAKTGHAALTTQDWATGRPHTAFTGVTSGDTKWTYSDTQIIGSKGSGHDLNPGGGGFPEQKADINQGHFEHQHDLSITGGGDDETRPQTIYAVYIIKAKV